MCIGPAYGGTGHHQPDTHNGCVLVGIVAIDGQQVRIGFLAGPTSGRPWNDVKPMIATDTVFACEPGKSSSVKQSGIRHGSRRYHL
jgi:hypothetical protein